MEMMGGRRWREVLFTELPQGRILELGVGTGANIEHYPHNNRTYAGIDISPKMLKYARERADRLHRPVELMVMDAQRMAFPGETFDAILSTFVFCSVPDPIQALREARRVIKKSGLALFLEHMRPEGEILGRAFDALNPVTLKLMGVSINRRTVENIRFAGFEIIEERLLFSTIFRFIMAKP